MRKSTFASLASLALTLSLALTGCQVGEEGDGGGGGNPGTPDAGGGNPGTPDAGGAQACVPDVNTFKTQVYDTVLAPKCISCHEGFAKFTLSSSDQTTNLNSAKAAAAKVVGSSVALLAKPSGAVTHSGGTVVAAGSTEYQALEKFVGQVAGTDCP